MKPSRSLSPLQTLAAKWRVIGFIALAFARLMRRKEEGRVPGTSDQAGQLALVVRTAQVLIFQELCETLQTAPPETQADQTALAQLRCIAVCLLAIAEIAETVSGRSLGAVCWMGEVRVARADAVKRPAGATASARPYLDPG